MSSYRSKGKAPSISPTAFEVHEQATVDKVICTWPTCGLSFPTILERDRHYQTIHANDGERPHKCLVPGCQAGVQSWGKADGLRAHNKQWHGPYHCPEFNCVRGIPNGFGSQADLDSHCQTVHGTQSSWTNYTTDPIESITKDLAQVRVEGEGPAISEHIVAGDPTTKSEKFDPSMSTPPSTDTSNGSCVDYRVHAEKEFKWGRVFKTLWAEPKGSKGQLDNLTDGTESMRVVKKGKYDEEHFEKVRRFVIISAKRGHCVCLPINTYCGQGTRKRGVHAEDHAIIYTERPTRFDGEREKGLTMEPIRVVPVSSRHKLDRASRLNYAKVYTVECNVKVWFIGRVHENSEDRLVADYNRVHPPMAAPGSYLPESSKDIFTHASGGTSGQYGPVRDPDSYYQERSASALDGGTTMLPLGSNSLFSAAGTSSYTQGPGSYSYSYGTYTQGEGGEMAPYFQARGSGYAQGGSDPYYQNTITSPYLPQYPAPSANIPIRSGSTKATPALASSDVPSDDNLPVEYSSSHRLSTEPPKPTKPSPE
ncbi:hypothetical protein LSUE1_G008387 [Lachnellula suecica]|uniref:C2H2-type domain-containing protein n=1 Tax=Lachnellula suecica TaxID=602035 RepID=A0A8T9C5B3_9HELO|nr:hypothetical protein LSUE1_G008387 [Lachnellula suecica]